jgi:hypothetical protein
MAALAVDHDHPASCGDLRPRCGNQARERGGAPFQGLAVGIGESVPLAAFHIQGPHHRPCARVQHWMIASDRVLAKAVR